MILQVLSFHFSEYWAVRIVNAENPQLRKHKWSSFPIFCGQGMDSIEMAI